MTARNATPAPRRPARPRRIVALACVMLGAVGIAVVWHEWVRDRVMPKRWSEVAGGVVYRSGQISAPLVERTLRRHGIRCIIDLTDSRTRRPDRDAERAACDRLGIRRVELPLEGDGRGDLESYVGAVREMVQAVSEGRPTLVHCQSGSQRVGGVVAVYRLLIERRAPAEVQAEMRAHDWRPGRDRVLVEFLNAHMGEIARRLVDAGLIEALPAPLPALDPGGD